jgi:hypothetical protein
MASDTKLKMSARLLLPEPLRPTTNSGLSKVRIAAGKLRKRFTMILMMGDAFINQPEPNSKAGGKPASSSRRRGSRQAGFPSRSTSGQVFAFWTLKVHGQIINVLTLFTNVDIMPKT